MREQPGRLRQRIRKLEESLALSLRHLRAERGPLRRGSFVTLHRKCGKPNCHCVQGERHPTDYLSTRQEGRTRLIYIGAYSADRERSDRSIVNTWIGHRERPGCGTSDRSEATLVYSSSMVPSVEPSPHLTSWGGAESSSRIGIFPASMSSVGFVRLSQSPTEPRS